MAGRPRDRRRARGEKLLRDGWSLGQVAREIGISKSTAFEWKAKLPDLTVVHKPNPNSIQAQEQRKAELFGGVAEVSDPIPYDDLCSEAQRALGDFAYFRRRYFGRVSSPWQEEAGTKLILLLDGPETEMVVINCPPGAGKSTLIHDVACWAICRNRAVRLLIVSASGRLVNQYTIRIRRSLERRYLLRADPQLVVKGLAVDAEATLVGDFGRFKPDVAELWRVEEFVVEQMGSAPLENKEPTVAGYGMDADYIGHRADGVFCDDVMTSTNSREGKDRDNLIEKWDGVTEHRVEPGGLLGLIGQRLSSTDLSKYCLGQMAGDDDDEEEAASDDEVRKVYRHIVYPAYYPELDTGPESRRLNAPPWPKGPLLDPRRIPWRKLSALRQNRADTFATVYQQEDGHISDHLVREVWAYGGTSAEGEMFPGCIDRGRRLGELPENLAAPVLSVASVDPSGEKQWAFVWELYQPDIDYRHIVDLARSPMTAGGVLSYDPTTRRCVGLMPEWQERSKAMGRPITHWIVEINAAQRFLLAHDYVRRWMSENHVSIIQHTTHRFNKDHAEYGIQALIPPIWRHGRIRLPERSGCWQVEAFIQEHLSWREGKRSGTDFVMAGWFPELHWPTVRPAGVPPPIHQNPEFLGQPWWRAMPA